MKQMNTKPQIIVPLHPEDINSLRKEYGSIITNATNIEEVGKSLLTLNDKINALDFQLGITKTIFDAYKPGL